MANLIPPPGGANAGTDAALQQIYTSVLDRAMGMPVVANKPWATRPRSIAFPLLGCTQGYGYLNSAVQAINAIESWFNGPGGAARRAEIVRIDLMIPDDRYRGAQHIEEAWLAAWKSVSTSISRVESLG
jgi:hypothetical protein